MTGREKMERKMQLKVPGWTQTWIQTGDVAVHGWCLNPLATDDFLKM